MRIYTKRGDGGETDLFGGGRVPKYAPRIEAIGAVDELNAAIGLAIVSQDQLLGALLATIQHDLFQLGAELAVTASATVTSRMSPLERERIVALERLIDRHEEELPPLRNFILPGGSEAGARLQVARGSCRRAERRVVALAQAESIRGEVVQYLNRLSDLLFVLARVANQRAGVADVLWQP